MDLPIAVGSLTELSNGAELESRILALAHQGLDDETIAQRLTAEGFRSPLSPVEVLPNTVRCIRLKHGVFVKRSQSHPRQIAGYLTVRRVIYTTNAIESLNRSLRRVLKTRGAFPNDEAIRKVLYLALKNVSKKWTMPIANWNVALNQFAILFAERMPK